MSGITDEDSEFRRCRLNSFDDDGSAPAIVVHLLPNSIELRLKKSLSIAVKRLNVQQRPSELGVDVVRDVGQFLARRDLRNET